jgi:hypothetical protein
MLSLLVVKRKVRFEMGLSRWHTVVIPEIDFFVFHGMPEPLNKDIIEGSLPTIPTDAGVGSLQMPCTLMTGKLNSLVTA